MAFTKDSLIAAYHEFLKYAELTPQQALVGSGGACVMFGIRERASDIDIEVMVDVFDRFLQLGFKEEVRDGPLGMVRVIDLGNGIDLHACEQLPDPCVVDGVATHPVHLVLARKLTMNRDKDQKDIQGLRRLLTLDALLENDVLQ